VMTSEEWQGAVRVWFSTPLPPLQDSQQAGADEASAEASSSGARASTPEPGGAGVEDDEEAVARALAARLPGLRLHACALSKSRRCCSLCVPSKHDERRVLRFFQVMLSRQSDGFAADGQGAVEGAGLGGGQEAGLGAWQRRVPPGQNDAQDLSAQDASSASGGEEDAGASEAAHGRDAAQDDDGHEGDGNAVGNGGRGGEADLDDIALRALSHVQDEVICVERRSRKTGGWQAVREQRPVSSPQSSCQAGGSAAGTEREGQVGGHGVAQEHSNRQWWLAKHVGDLSLHEGIVDFLDGCYCPVESREALLDLVLYDLPNLSSSSRAQPCVWVVQGASGSGKSSVLARLARRLQARALGQRAGDMVISASKRPGMSLLALCNFLVDDLWLHLRGSMPPPPYYSPAAQLGAEASGAAGHGVPEHEAALDQGQQGAAGEEEMEALGALQGLEEGLEGLEGLVSVLHGGKSILSVSPCHDGVRIWADREDYTLRGLPRILDGSSLVQLPCQLHEAVDIVVRAAATIYAFFPLPRTQGVGEAEASDHALEPRDAADGAARATGARQPRDDGGLAGRLREQGWVEHDVRDVMGVSCLGLAGPGLATVFGTSWARTCALAVPCNAPAARHQGPACPAFPQMRVGEVLPCVWPFPRLERWCGGAAPLRRCIAQQSFSLRLRTMRADVVTAHAPTGTRAACAVDAAHSVS